MKDVLIVFLFVAVVGAIGFATLEENTEYNFPTGNMLRRCLDHAECGVMMYCENLGGTDGGVDGRRGKHCKPKFTEGMSCFEHIHCRTGYCNTKTNMCSPKINS